MKNLPVLLSLAAVCLLLSQNHSAAQEGRLVEARKIWDAAPHNAFTDLVRFRDKWFCVFREGQGHVSPDGAIRVITSTDGVRWESAALITSPDSDLRDAKITVTPDGKLMLCGAEALHDKSKHTHQSLAWFSDDGRTWGQQHEIGDPNFWLWRVTWYQGTAYGLGYGVGPEKSVRLYSSKDGKTFDTLVERLYDVGYPNESSIVFHDDTAYCLLRRDGKPNAGLIGTAKKPYTDWKWKELNARTGGPHMIRLDDGRFVAAVRLYDGKVRTSLCWLDPETAKLKEFLQLPSGGDTSYPGLVMHDGLLWVSYYSSHEGKTSIYLAKVELPAPVPDIGSRRELFVDDYLLQSHAGAELTMHQPEPRDVAIVCDAPWEGNISAYYTIFADGDLFRMYYRGAHWDEVAKKATHPEVTCYAESKDGITWTKPALGIHEFNGSKENNIVWTGAGSHNFSPFVDGNPESPPESRYKALAGGRGGLLPIHSPDGVHWSLMQEKPVITNGAFDSQNLAFWDAERGEYRAYWRYFEKKSRVRAIRTATSKDFIHWQHEADLQYGGIAEEHLYTNAIRPYFRAPHLFVGFPTRFQPKNEQVEPVLMTSRDGVNFHRWPEPLVPIDAPQDRDGNRSNYMVHGLLQVPGQDREMSVYATEAYYAGPASRVRRFTFRTDGFVSLKAGSTPAEVVTHPLRFDGTQLSLNYVTQGSGKIQVELQDADGRPLPGFALDDCQSLTGDQIDGTVTWKAGSNVRSLAGKTVRLRFVMQDADLYAMQFMP